MTALRWGSATDVGRVRDNNEDQLLVAEPLFAVADGMGGHNAGEVASQVAVDTLRTAFDDAPHTPEGLAGAIEAANEAVWERASSGQEFRGMGTTVTALALVQDDDGIDRFAIANVGDSRAYLLRDGELTQLTDDHSVAEEMVRSGQLNSEAAAVHPQRHMLTRVLGMSAEVDVDLFLLDIFRGDRLLLASDGLNNEVTDAQIASTLRRLADPDEAARELIAQAKANGGNDNITVVVVDVVDDDAKAETAALANEAPPAGASRMLSATERDAQLQQLAQPDSAGRASAVGEPAMIEPPPRRVTGRVIAFLVVLVVIIGGAAAATVWYARSSYYVGLDGGEVAIFQGRPGGVLFIDPKLDQATGIDEADLSPRVQRRLEGGVVQSSRAEARRYVERLRDDLTPVPTSTTTTAPAASAPATSTP